MSTIAVEKTPLPLLEQPKTVIPNKIRHVDMLIDFMGGVAGGTASVYVGQPLDTVKVKMQTFPTMYRSATDCFRCTFRDEGLVRGLYAGTMPSLAAQVSENAMLFMAYGLCQKLVARFTQTNDAADLSVIQNAVAGSFAAFFSSLTLCPTELIKCKMQVVEQMRNTGQLEPEMAQYKHMEHIGPLSLTKEILREEGIRGMYRGLMPTILREMPGYFFFFGGYEISRALLTPPGKTKDDLSPLCTVASGAMGGVSLWLAVFPADVIKSRIQVQVGELHHKRLSMLAITRMIIRQEGVAALYKGLGPTLLRTMPATGALFLAFETVKKCLSGLAYDDDS